MSNKSANILKSKPVRKSYSPKKPGTATSLYAGITSAERSLKQQRSAQLRRPVQSKREGERPITCLSVNDNLLANYHPWESEYHKIITREKNIKSMTKDPYTPLTRLIDHSVECVTTEEECYPTLVSAKAVKIETFHIQHATRPPMPTIIHYLRRNELLPSERLASSIPEYKPLLPQLSYRRPTITVMNSNKLTAVAPTLATTNRLLNRSKTRNDGLIIQRPIRKLLINASHETIMPLSVYG